MDTTNFKNIVGEIKQGEVATIRFFHKITEESTSQFNTEFDFLENCVRPSLIRVLINSEGGSVLHGMTTYSTIQNSKIPTECIIEGMAASMASVIWASGNKSLMRDYSILMIHNPFLPSSEEAKASDLVQAFTKQITTIYRKRFGLGMKHIQSIMDGEAGKDGTFFDANAAVKAGIITINNILNTSKQLCEKVKDEISGIEDMSEIQSFMSRISAEATTFDIENKHFPQNSPTLKQTIVNNTNLSMSKENNNSIEFTAVIATLGMGEKTEMKDVMARLSELTGVEAKLSEITKALTDAKTVIAGKDATIQNLEKDVTTITTSLKTYQEKEAQEQKEQIENLVNAAISEGKIDAVNKAQWVEMATSNYALAENTLSSIPVREQISKEIANDPANVLAAQNAAKSEAEKLSAQVTAIVGESFQFRKIR